MDWKPNLCTHLRWTHLPNVRRIFLKLGQLSFWTLWETAYLNEYHLIKKERSLTWVQIAKIWSCVDLRSYWTEGSDKDKVTGIDEGEVIGAGRDAPAVITEDTITNATELATARMCDKTTDVATVVEGASTIKFILVGILPCPVAGVDAGAIAGLNAGAFTKIIDDRVDKDDCWQGSVGEVVRLAAGVAVVEPFDDGILKRISVDNRGLWTSAWMLSRLSSLDSLAFSCNFLRLLCLMSGLSGTAASALINV